jgi:hypothetical protein
MQYETNFSAFRWSTYSRILQFNRVKYFISMNSCKTITQYLYFILGIHNTRFEKNPMNTSFINEHSTKIGILEFTFFRDIKYFLSR